MTNYFLSLGYQGGDTPYVSFPQRGEQYKDFLWKKLKENFYQVCTNTQRLKADILTLGFQKLKCHDENEDEKTLDECLCYLSGAFKNGSDSYPGINEEDRRIVFDTNCRTKYQVYRAVIRNVFFEMHKIGIEVNIEVR